MRTIVRNGVVYDGTGAQPFVADLAIDGDRITEVAPNVATDGSDVTVIEAAGMAVAPGFIDVHTHDDFAALFHRDMAFKSRGGVTTCIVGNCGLGAAPWEPASFLARSFHPSHDVPNYDGYGGYMARLEEQPPGVNIGVLAGHGTIRAAVVGNEQRAPSDNEMETMRALVAEAVDAGVLGLSTGLIYEPGRYAATEEIIELASVMRGTGALYATHMRDEGAGLLDSVHEALKIGRDAGVPVQISHHKVTGRANWGLVAESLRLIEEAREQGQVVNADQYPYTAGSTILQAVLQNEMFDDPDDIVVAACAENPAWEGRSLGELAREWDVTPAVAGSRILDTDSGTTVILHSMCEPDVETVLAHPSTMIGSDGLPTLEGRPHPRLYNTFARVLGHYSRERGVLPMAEAIHRMSGYPADAFGLVDRGVIRPGAFADLVVFDPDAVIDRGTFTDPNRYPEGITRVLVNGVEVVSGDQHSGAFPGRVLRRG